MHSKTNWKNITLEGLLHKACHPHGFRSCSNEVSVVYMGAFCDLNHPCFTHHQPVGGGSGGTGGMNHQDASKHVTFKDQLSK